MCIDIVSHNIIIQPNVKTYIIMIGGLCNGGLIAEAEKLLMEMEEEGCSPNSWTYNTIIRGFINSIETNVLKGLPHGVPRHPLRLGVRVAAAVLREWSGQKASPEPPRRLSFFFFFFFSNSQTQILGRFLTTSYLFLALSSLCFFFFLIFNFLYNGCVCYLRVLIVLFILYYIYI